MIASETGWRDASREIPKMHTEIFEDFDYAEDYEVSDPVLAFTESEEYVVARRYYDAFGKPWWFSEDGKDLKVLYWQPLPGKPKEDT